MCRLWYLLALPLALMCGVLGCQNPDAHLKPPKPPDVLGVPPEADARFSEPQSYPKNLLFQDSIHNVGGGDPSGVPGAGGMHGGGSGGAGPGGH